MNTKNRRIAAALIIVLVLGFGSGFFLSGIMEKNSPENRKLREIKSVIDDNYLFGDSPESEEDWIYSGLVSSIGDKYAMYFSEDEFREFNSENEGNYVGIGGQIQEDAVTGEKSFTVIYKDGPADKAGLKAGDVLLEADGVSVDGKTITEVVSGMVKGAEGTEVVLKVFRPDTGETPELTAVRASILTPTVAYRMLEDKTGYIRVTEFLETTAADFAAAVDALQGGGAAAIVIDLRLNPGGILDSAVKMADYIIEDGLLENSRCFSKSSLVYTLDKSGNSVSYVAGDGHEVDLPVAVILNGGSASASELFSAALRDSGKAVIVGSKSYGKGIVQSTYSLKGGGAVKMTVSQYYTPSGYALHGLGLEPDVETEQNTVFEPADKVINDESVDKLSADSETKTAIGALNEIRDGRRALKVTAGEESGKIEAPDGFQAEACGGRHFSLTLDEAEGMLPGIVEKNGLRLFRCEDDWLTGDEVEYGTAGFERMADIQLLESESGESYYFFLGSDPADGRIHWFEAEDMPPEKAAAISARFIESGISEGKYDSVYEKLVKVNTDNGRLKLTGDGYELEAEGSGGHLSVTVYPK